MSPIQAIVFDLDGTLMESRIDYETMSNKIRDLLRSKGMTEALEDRRKIFQVIRGNEETLLQYGLPESSIQETLIEMNLIMNSIELQALKTIALKPYAEITLMALQNDGYKLGIATRSHREYALRSLDKYHLRDYFHGIMGRDDVPYPKPDPRHLIETIKLIGSQPETTLYIGDTTTDLVTAKAANVEFLGYWRNDEWAMRLIDGGCTKIIKDLREIIDIVKTL